MYTVQTVFALREKAKKTCFNIEKAWLKQQGVYDKFTKPAIIALGHLPVHLRYPAIWDIGRPNIKTHITA